MSSNTESCPLNLALAVHGIPSTGYESSHADRVRRLRFLTTTRSSSISHSNTSPTVMAAALRMPLGTTVRNPLETRDSLRVMTPHESGENLMDNQTN
jgi:hypothetical protein